MTARPRRIVLVGMMGAGKTTVARELSSRLGWPLLDNDRQILAATGRDGPTIFREGGENALHAAERDAFLAATRDSEPSIVTVAGSVVDDPELRARLRRAGHVVWLRAAAATLEERIERGRGRRSDAADAAWIARLAVDREPRYAAVADQVVDVDERPVSAIADAIEQAFSRESSAG